MGTLANHIFEFWLPLTSTEEKKMRVTNDRIIFGKLSQKGSGCTKFLLQDKEKKKKTLSNFVGTLKHQSGSLIDVTLAL